jgi:hypothetical protein
MTFVVSFSSDFIQLLSTMTLCGHLIVLDVCRKINNNKKKKKETGDKGKTF